MQHALRAFTAKDRKAIKLTAQNYPDTDYYDTAEVLTSLGIGEALVSALDEKGRPTPLAATMMRAPMSRMDILSPKELNALLDDSKLVLKYNDEVDRESAYEMLNEKIKKAEELKAKEAERLAKEEAKLKAEEAKAKEREKASRRSSSRRSSSRMNPVVKVLTSATFIRAVFGILKKVVK